MSFWVDTGEMWELIYLFKVCLFQTLLNNTKGLWPYKNIMKLK